MAASSRDAVSAAQQRVPSVPGMSFTAPFSTVNDASFASVVAGRAFVRSPIACSASRVATSWPFSIFEPTQPRTVAAGMVAACGPAVMARPAEVPAVSWSASDWACWSDTWGASADTVASTTRGSWPLRARARSRSATPAELMLAPSEPLTMLKPSGVATTLGSVGRALPPRSARPVLSWVGSRVKVSGLARSSRNDDSQPMGRAGSDLSSSRLNAACTVASWSRRSPSDDAVAL